MTWAEFVDLVEEHLSVDAQRRGLEDFRERMMRNAVVNLQRFIPSYQQFHKTTYEVADLTEMERAMLGDLPEGAIPHAFYIYSLQEDSEGDTHPNCRRNRLDFWSWPNRKHLICGRCDERLYAYALSPGTKQFLIHPVLNDETRLLLVWQGLKLDFEDADDVPWPGEAAEPVAAYVKWRILLEIDRNPQLAQQQQVNWNLGRLSLYRDQNEKLDAEKSDNEYDATTVAPP